MTQEQLFISQQSSSDMGRKGEQFALEYERHRLPAFLHDKIVHLGHYEVARGYDILSCEDANSILPDRYIEVKTFRGHPHFYWTDNEIAAARKYGEHYYLYLVDIDRVGDASYEPTIIPNPATLFEDNLCPNSIQSHACTASTVLTENKCVAEPPSLYSATSRKTSPQQWSILPQQYIFSLISNEQIPADWDSSTILLGCYNNEQHLQWILSHNLYNVRAQKDSPGAVTLTNPQVQHATYLILYSVANPRVYMLYSLEANPYKVTKTEMLAQGYPNPHAFSYILHPIQKQLDSFHIDLTTLLREVNHTSDRTYGTPLYLNGTQLRRFMVDGKRQNENPMSEVNLVSESKVSDHPIQSKKGSLWSQDEEALLLEHLKANIPIADISKELSRTEKAIARRMDRLRSQRSISFNLYMSYYDNDPAFASHRRFKRFD